MVVWERVSGTLSFLRVPTLEIIYLYELNKRRGGNDILGYLRGSCKTESQI